MAKPGGYAITTQDGVDVVRLVEPKIAQSALADLQAQLGQRIEDGSRKMVINLAPVAFVDSFGIGVIAATVRQMAAAGGRLVLCGVGERVMMSLTITRLDRSIEIAPDEAQALRRLTGNG